MQLRTGKITTVVTAPKKTRIQKREMSDFEYQEQLYLNEIQAMMDELEEWSDCPSARMAGLVDIYEYVNDHCDKFTDLHTLHHLVGKSAVTVLSDIGRIAPTADKETLHHMKILAPLLISVIAKLG